MNVKIYDTLHEDAFAIRREVFVNEQGLIDTPEPTDGVSRHIVLYDGELPVATCRIAPIDEGCVLLGRIAVRLPYRKGGLGSKILSIAERDAKERGISKIKIHAQYHARDFYKKCGYNEISEPDEVQGVPHVWFEKTV